MDFCQKLSQSLVVASKRKPPTDLCKRAGQKDIQPINIFINVIIKSLEVISMGLRSDDLKGNFPTAPWDHDSKSTATLLYMD